jgi:hypothetical protein
VNLRQLGQHRGNRRPDRNPSHLPVLRVEERQEAIVRLFPSKRQQLADPGAAGVFRLPPAELVA